MMKKVKIIFNHFVDELKTDLLSVKDELKTDLLTLKDKLKTSLLTLKEEARSPSTKNNVRLLGVFLCILMLVYFNTQFIRYHYTYQFNYPCQYLKDSHILITQVYDYLKKFDPHFNRLNIWYQAGQKDGVAFANEIIAPESLGKPRCRKFTYGEEINLTEIYHGVFGSRYFSTISGGGDGTFTRYNNGNLFDSIPPGVYSYIYHKDMVAIFSNDDKKHQTALNTLKKIHKENLTEEELAKISLGEEPKGSGYAEWKYKIITEIAEEITIEVVDKKSFSSGLMSFKVTIVRFHVPKFYKKHKSLNALKSGAVKLEDL
jgi:hypothetical protein|tara:strand:+ start:344 stop:1291 length:948 start_codon:yes stop_codon:yes gene_type:complete